MKELNINLEIINQDLNSSKIFFRASSELLLSGFKFSYVAPERLEEEVYNICKKNSQFLVNAKSNCLEESLFNCQQNSFQASNTNQLLDVRWN